MQLKLTLWLFAHLSDLAKEFACVGVATNSVPMLRTKTVKTAEMGGIRYLINSIYQLAIDRVDLWSFKLSIKLKYIQNIINSIRNLIGSRFNMQKREYLAKIEYLQNRNHLRMLYPKFGIVGAHSKIIQKTAKFLLDRWKNRKDVSVWSVLLPTLFLPSFVLNVDAYKSTTDFSQWTSELCLRVSYQ